MSNLKEETHVVTDQLVDKIHKAVDKTAAGMASTEARLRQEAGGASAKLREGVDYAQHRSGDVINTVTTYVRENPLAALGLAFVAGSILSALTRRH